MKKKLIITSAIAAIAVFWAFAARQTESSDVTAQSDTHISGRLISQDDFTRAAEETVNGVVSVKSYASVIWQPGRLLQRSFARFLLRHALAAETEAPAARRASSATADRPRIGRHNKP